MTRKLLALSCAALTVLMLSAILAPADARRGGGGHGFSRGHGGHSFGRGFSGGPRLHGGHRFHHGRHHHHRRFRGIYLGAPYVYDGYYSYASCSWLRRRALRTGSPYWWNRYYDCIGY